MKSNQNRSKYENAINLFEDYYAAYREDKFDEAAYEKVVKMLIE